MGRPAKTRDSAAVAAAAERSTWNTACPDWQERIRAGRSLLPDLPLNRSEAADALRIFELLRLPDVPGTPRLAEACGPWFKDAVRALFGAFDPATGIRHISELFVLVPKKNSKALALDTLIATPSGFTTMGAVRVGDSIIDAAGNPTTVVAKSEVFTGRECFEVEFSTGERVVCDADHLWVTDAHRDRERQARTRKNRSDGSRKSPLPTPKTTREIAATLKVQSGRCTINNHRTAICGAVALPTIDLPIPPYALGVWLGDGTSTQSTVTAGLDHVDDMASRLREHGQPAFVRSRYRDKGSATIALGREGDTRVRARGDTSYRFRTEAARLELLGRKHIPPAYLRASIEQRMQLLQGLMDTDGNISKRGEAAYTTTSPRLRDDVLELVASLGFKATVNQWTARIDGRDCGLAWRVRFHPFADRPVFLMPHKAERQGRRPDSAARSESRQIVAVRPVPSVPTQCLAVASDTHQFLVTRSMIPTHNTSYGAALMLTAMFMSRRPRAEFLFVAPTQEVADLAYKQAVGMIYLDPVLSAKCHVQEHIRRVARRDTGAFLKIKSFDTRVVTGSKPAGVLLDEVHVIAESHDADRVVGQLRGGLISQPEGFIVQISTQSERPPAGVFKAELQKARNVRDGKLTAPILPLLYEFPREVNWRDPANWPMVLPNAGRSVSLARLETEYRSADDAGPEELRRWASQHLNVEIGLALMSDAWGGAEYWQRQGEQGLTLDALIERSEVLVVGLDGGGLDDMLGLCVMGREMGTGTWLVWSRAWVHPIALERRKADSPRMRDFAADGDLVIVERKRQDVQEVADIVMRCEDTGMLDQCGLDPACVAQLLDALEEAGVPKEKVTGVSQGWKLTGAIQTCERRLAEGALVHGGQPLMAWCVGNAKVEPRGNAITITKQAAGRAKIDPLMAMFNAGYLMGMNPAAYTGTVYEAIGRQRVAQQEAMA